MTVSAESGETTWEDYHTGVDRMLVVHKKMLEASKLDEQGRCMISTEASAVLFSRTELALMLAIALDRLAVIENRKPGVS